MAFLNKWLEPYQRSFISIKSKLLLELDNIKDDEGKPLITDKSEGNILVLLISMFSAIAEVLHFYIDRVGEESFLGTANRRESLVRHANSVDYNLKSYNPATVDVILSREDTSSTVILSSTTVLEDSQGLPWKLIRDEVFPKNASLKTVSLIQVSDLVSKQIPIEDIDDEGNLIIEGFSNEYYYAEGTMSLSISGETYTLVDSFSKAKSTDTVFKVTPLNNTSVLVTFGDGQFGKKPSTTGTIFCTYRVTSGSRGNIPVGTLDITWPNHSDIQIKNVIPGSGGFNIENGEVLRNRISASIKTLDVAISKEDFRDLALTRPGVGQAAIEYECGRKLNIYIATTEGNVPSKGLCSDVKNYIQQHCPLTTWLDVKPVGITPIVLEVNITGKKSYKKDYIQNQVILALNNRYSAGNTKINEAVRLSDIYALIDNLESVDYLTISKFYLVPWPKRLSGGSQLNIGTYTLTKCNNPQEYILVKTLYSWAVYSKYNNTTNLQLSTGNDIKVEDKNNGNSFTIAFDPNTVLPSEGSRYSIYITWGNATTQDPGFNLPVIDTSSNNVTLNITETL